MSDLDLICTVLGYGVEELLIPDPDKVSSGTREQKGPAATADASAGSPKVTPRRRDGRSLPRARWRAVVPPSCADCLAMGVCNRFRNRS